MPTTYPNLSIPAPRRLAIFRAEAAEKHWARPMTWRDVRFATLRSSSGLDQGLNDETPIWYTTDEQFRNERDAHDVARLGHHGWFTDAEGFPEDLAIGIVAGLPHGRFLTGYRLTMNDERVYFGEIFDDEGDAARMADEHARIVGESESEYAAKERAEMEREDAAQLQEDADAMMAGL
jgi:hypothetical protein